MVRIIRKLLLAGVMVMMVVSFADAANLEKATFAGGCFWCMEPPFEKLDGVKEVVSGYTGGHKENPTYEEVSSGKTGHVEAVQVSFDPSRISYGKLLDVLWRQIDPTDPGGQFVDRGAQYRSVIFSHSPEQKALAQKSRDELHKSDASRSLLLPRFFLRGNSILRKSITRITTKRTQFGISSTGTIQGATSS